MIQRAKFEPDVTLDFLIEIIPTRATGRFSARPDQGAGPIRWNLGWDQKLVTGTDISIDFTIRAFAQTTTRSSSP